MLCPECKGSGSVLRVIKPIHGRSEPSDYNMHITPCYHPCCKNGQIDQALQEEYSKSWQNWGKSAIDIV